MVQAPAQSLTTHGRWWDSAWTITHGRGSVGRRHARGKSSVGEAETSCWDNRVTCLIPCCTTPATRGRSEIRSKSRGVSAIAGGRNGLDAVGCKGSRKRRGEHARRSWLQPSQCSPRDCGRAHTGKRQLSSVGTGCSGGCTTVVVRALTGRVTRWVPNRGETQAR
jgi:hypothetical protein